MLNEAQINAIIQKSLDYEDPSISLCATFCFQNQKKIKADICTNQDRFVSGIRLVHAMFDHFYKKCSLKEIISDGEYARKGEVILTLEGPLADLLEAKETILYYLSRMTAITDSARKYCLLLEDLNFSKTLIEGRFWTPGMIILEKFASSLGGVKNHKRFFQKSITIEENHLSSGESITSLVNKLEESLSPTTKIQVHPINLEQVKEAANLGVDLIVLKNFQRSSLKMAFRIIQERSLIEVTGDLTEDEVEAFCSLPINFISTDLIIKNSGYSSFSFKTINS